ncbi:hypothetical protein L6164_014588 [Bauhinia variegata]|uniref:Uncharacterized protein n=1 Tax=Bauhinia variegata TaxID=167791 RepID=A0ACB9NI01_BAUVA|nr:hypothetical protein L6164_014588 [Bauhinia variegata]
MRGRIGSWWSHPKTVALLIWLISAFIFFSLFLMALRNSSDTTSSSSFGNCPLSRLCLFSIECFQIFNFCFCCRKS